MAKILTITLNPAIDVTIELEHLEVGCVNRHTHLEQLAAGKGLNVAQVLHDLGHDVVVTGFLGQHNSDIFQQHFTKMSFDDQFIYIDGETRQNIKVAEQSGRMTDINGLGFYVTEQDKKALLQKINDIAHHADIIVIAGSLPRGFEQEDFKSLLLLAKSKQAKVAIDTSGQSLVTAIECDPWMIKPNTDELKESFSQSVEDIHQQQQLFHQLDSNIEHIVISMGEDGVNWFYQDHVITSSTPQVTVKSTVGAGDSLLAAMIHEVNQHHDVMSNHVEILKTATAIASHAVSQIGFQIPNSERLDDLKKQITIKNLS